jgi:hypothetical protein
MPPLRSRVWLLGFAILLALALLPAGVSARSPSVPVFRLSRPLHEGGCCTLQIERLSATSVSVLDPASGFSAVAGPFVLRRSRLIGYAIVWIWVVERNESNIANALMSGPSNWLLRARDGLHSAFPAMPPHRGGHVLARVNALVADTDPENDGWIAFRIPLHSGPRFTLFWSNCRPRCDQDAGLAAYAAVVDLEISGSSRES